MNMKKELLRCFGLFATAMTIVVSSCSETEYMTYNPSNNGIYFNHDTVEFAFSVMPVEYTSHVINVPVKLMGLVSDQPRTFTFDVEYEMPSDSLLKLIYVSDVKSFAWAQEGKHFSVPSEGVIPAGSSEGVIPVTVYRRELEGNYIDGYVYYRIVLRLHGNESFFPTLSEKDQVRIVEFTNAIDQPAWYDAYGNKVWLETYYGVWHPYKFIKMVEYFHELKDILPETYKNMVKEYGENLERMEYGSDYKFRTVFKKYVYSKMYEHFNDPANHPMIDELYPGFPYDFPDPFAK